ncbi:MAG: PEP-CTERM sorting domain-containing protein [Deltaproteobacteria bacterium]|nr:PEP-CTERM sorting domain-containing protein [Deltaproteobacteria bacterium]
MKKPLCGIAFLMCFFLLATSVSADLLVEPVNSLYTNPQWVTPSDPTTEGAWLDGLLGFHVDFISKDEDSNPLDNIPSSWTYAVLKYGVGKPSFDNPDHWAIYDSNDNNLIDFPSNNIWGLPTTGLSHVSYFGPTSVPEPATMVLLGMGLFALAAFGRKKFK